MSQATTCSAAPQAESTPQQRTAARLAAGATCYTGRPNNTVPVCVLAGSTLAPRLLGHGYYHTTPSGKTIVHHPNAYGWPTWYHASTYRVLVGSEWIREHAAA